MTEQICKKCSQPAGIDARSCEHCGAPIAAKSSLGRLAYLYFGGGIAFLGLYSYLVDLDGARVLALRWLAVGVSLVMIVYGRAKRHESDVANLVYLAGLAMLVFLLVVGIILVINQGIAVPKVLEWLR